VAGRQTLAWSAHMYGKIRASTRAAAALWAMEHAVVH
jgi:hypothetical protein